MKKTIFLVSLKKTITFLNSRLTGSETGFQETVDENKNEIRLCLVVIKLLHMF
jgi:hypothetical protein